MKKLFLLLLLVPVICHAQYAEVSANLGLIPGARPKVVADPASSVHVSDVKPVMKGFCSVRLSMNIRRIQFGIAADVFGVEYSQKVTQFYLVGGSVKEISVASTAIVTQPAVCPNVFVNYKFYLPNSYIYVGGTFGQLFNMNSRTLVTNYPTEIIYPACKGLYYGGQSGYAIVVGDRTRINLETGVRYTDATLEKGTSQSQTGILGWKQLSFPITIGMRYRFTRS
ncbi:MAG: hypothetical protein JWQ38_909 [Flavipsychrobacter sp.]|nr:hypothetical protein [Flavipsychrobacter sp.]